MKSRSTKFVPVKLSLADIAGADYINAVASARAALTEEPPQTLRALATRRIEFFPAETQERLLELIPRIGKQVGRTLAKSAVGASTLGFLHATKTHQAPLSAYGYYRVAENGKLYFIAKSEHYHASLMGVLRDGCT